MKVLPRTLFKQKGGKLPVCTYCRQQTTRSTKTKLGLSEDHIVPRSLGGTRNDGVNISCRGCNGLRGNMPYEYWLIFMESYPRWWEKNRRERRLMLREFTMKFRELNYPGQPSGSAKAYEEVKQEEKENNVVQLITGGKEPPSTGDCWLDDLPLGALFTVQDKLASDIRDPNYFITPLFKLADRDGKVTYLQSADNPKGIPVNPVRFCNRFSKYEEITGYVLAKEQEQERAQQNERDRLQRESGSPVPDVE